MIKGEFGISRAELSTEQRVSMAKGIALAAFLPRETLARMLGCSVDEAEAFKQGALCDWQSMMVEVAQAKHKMGITQ